MEKINQPSAFPHPEVFAGDYPAPRLAASEGMTLRDYFAAKVLEGSFSDPNVMENISNMAAMKSIPGAIIRSAYCYEIADAMLVQRAK